MDWGTPTQSRDWSWRPYCKLSLVCESGYITLRSFPREMCAAVERLDSDARACDMLLNDDACARAALWGMGVGKQKCGYDDCLILHKAHVRCFIGHLTGVVTAQSRALPSLFFNVDSPGAGLIEKMDGSQSLPYEMGIPTGRPRGWQRCFCDFLMRSCR